MSACSSCDFEYGKCSLEALPCDFTHYYNKIFDSCKERKKTVENCILYQNWYQDDAQCERCNKGYVLNINEATNDEICEKSMIDGQLKCLDNCTYCWKKRTANGNLLTGCLGCDEGYEGVGWIEGNVFQKCVAGTCDENCITCSLSDSNQKVCLGCKERYIIDYNDRQKCV